MGFLHPQLLLLAIPAALAWSRWRGPTRAGAVVRALVAALLVVAAAAPYLETSERGRDLIVVVDRSRSMPVDSDQAALETLTLAQRSGRDGDRIGVVAFGANAAIEAAPREGGWADGFSRVLDRDGSDLATALDTALAMLPAERPGSILLLSDGESNGRDPLAVARAAFARGVRVDVKPLLRADAPDIAVEGLDAPTTVGVAEPFQLHAWVRAAQAGEIEFVLERDGVELSRGVRTLAAGVQRWTFRDVLTNSRIAEYRLRLIGAADQRPENDAATTAVGVEGQRPVLIVNSDGADDTLALALRRAAIPVLVTSPEDRRVDRLALAGVRAVILENVAADRMGSKALAALREFVRERGGGLLMTGGRASFGIGGYHRSVLDDLLPVSMEMRQEARKLGLAMAIALDRSGSMAMEAAPGVPKMDLANQGACAAIELLSPIDSVGLIAVDSSDHVFQPLTPVDDPTPLMKQARTIESSGGGIYCYTALLAAGRMLEDATQSQRHIVLFADAADSEEQEGCPELIEKLVRMGMTLSVVALGSPSDSDAEFLQRCAEQGQGACYFTTDPSELPRLFAQDTLTIARATFLEESVACEATVDLIGLGDARAVSRGFCSFDGCNVTWLRDGASCGAVVANEYRSPAFAFMQSGLGRTAAFTGQLGGQYGAPVVAWDDFASFFVTLARWLAGQEEPTDVFASATRDGRLATIRVEFDPHAAQPADTSTLEVHLSQPDGTARRVELERIGEHVFEARTSLDREGVVLGAVSLGDGRKLTLPPLTLPYSPEFEVSADPTRGETLLRQLARETGGEVAPPMGEIFRGERSAKAWRVVSREFAFAALVLLLLEIGARRLELWGTLAGLVRVVFGRIAPRPRVADEQAPTANATAPSSARAPAPPPAELQRAPTSAARSERGPTSLDDALSRARRSADRELDR